MQKESEERIPHERLAYDAKEVATLIGCSVTTVFKMIREEKLGNDGNVKRHTMERLESFVSGTKGKRLTYKGLIQ